VRSGNAEKRAEDHNSKAVGEFVHAARGFDIKNRSGITALNGNDMDANDDGFKAE